MFVIWESGLTTSLQSGLHWILALTSINEHDTYGKTALCHAAENGHTAIMELLLNRGADVGFSALGLAFRRGHMHGDRAAVAESRGATDTTIFVDDVDCWLENTAMVDLQLSTRADVNLQRENGCTALFGACCRGHAAMTLSC